MAELKFKVLASLGKLAFYFSFITKHWFSYEMNLESKKLMQYFSFYQGEWVGRGVEMPPGHQSPLR